MKTTFANCTSLRKIYFPKLAYTQEAGSYKQFEDMLLNCSDVELDFTGLQVINNINSAFKGITGITSVNLGDVTTINRYGSMYTFMNCTSLVSVNLSKLT